MRRGYRPSRRPRRIGAEEVTRILSRGGVIAEIGGRHFIWRTPDTRRMKIGFVRPEVLDVLEAAHAIRRDTEMPGRYVAGRCF